MDNELTFSTFMSLLQPIEELWNVEKALQQAMAIAEGAAYVSETWLLQNSAALPCIGDG